jgi:hypothetical protein
MPRRVAQEPGTAGQRRFWLTVGASAVTIAAMTSESIEIHWNGQPVGMFTPYVQEMNRTAGTWKPPQTTAAEDFLNAFSWKRDDVVPNLISASGIGDNVCVDLQLSPPLRMLVLSTVLPSSLRA